MGAVEQFEWVNPRSLERARERLRLSITDVVQQADQFGSDYAGITAIALESWEAGRHEPELRHLEALSQIYVCPVGWFFLPSIPSEPAALDFRGVAPGATVGARGMQTLSRFLELADWAEDVAIQTGQFAAPQIGLARIEDTMHHVVAAERQRLGFHAGARIEWTNNEDAFRWWRRQIENLGVYCFLMRLPVSEVRGASHWGRHGAAFILVNSEDAEAATGRTFTLLHEYAHLILRESRVCDFRGSRDGEKIERFANLFAARMLLDRNEVEERLRELDVHEFRSQWGDGMLDKIRAPFHVSRDVVSIYLEELELAPKGSYRKKRGVWGKQKAFGRSKTPQGGRTQPVQRLRMVGSTLARVLSSKEAESTLSVLDLAEVLDVKVEKVPAVLEAFRQGGDGE
jgi:Zn-dependent peptidase ImmA (M78 family)